ncbi:MAG: hypothetical protein ACYTF0_03500, partial [Planctomycetota bacterium]
DDEGLSLELGTAGVAGDTPLPLELEVGTSSELRPSDDLTVDGPELAVDDDSALELPGGLGTDEAEAPPLELAEDSGLTLEVANSGAGASDLIGSAAQPVVTAPSPELSPDLMRAASELHRQLTQTLSWFRAQLRQPRLEVAWVGLLGGAAEVPGLAAYLGRRLSLPVTVVDPFAGVLVEGGGPRRPLVFAQALAVALAGDGGRASFNLVPEGRQRREGRRQRVLWPRVAAAVLIVAFVLYAWYAVAAEATLQERITAYRGHDQKRQALLAELQAGQTQRDAMLTDLGDIAGRVFGGRDLLYAIRALKEQAPEELWVTALRTRETSAGGSQRERGSSAGSPRRNRSRPAAGAAPAASGADNLISKLYLTGFVKPEPGREITDYYGSFVRWYESLVAWQPQGSADSLLVESEVTRWSSRREDADAEGRYSFDLRFTLRPTQWDEVASFEDDQR